MLREGAEHLSEESFKRAKRDFFEKQAFKHWPEMRLLFRGGHLWKHEGWRNVAEHCLVQTVAVETLSDMLDLSEEDRKQLAKSALCHDWSKRVEIKPNDFSSSALQQARRILESINPDPKLLESTGPDFLKKALNDEVSFLQKVQFYADDICKGSEIVPFDERIDEVAARRTDLDENSELAQELGMPYWDAERKVGHKIEEEIAQILKQKGVAIDFPNQIPSIIMEKINNNILSSGLNSSISQDELSINSGSETSETT